MNVRFLKRRTSQQPLLLRDNSLTQKSTLKYLVIEGKSFWRTLKNLKKIENPGIVLHSQIGVNYGALVYGTSYKTMLLTFGSKV